MITINVTNMNVRRLRWRSMPRAVLTATTVEIAIHAIPTARAMSTTNPTGNDIRRKTNPGELAKKTGRARDQ